MSDGQSNSGARFISVVELSNEVDTLRAENTALREQVRCLVSALRVVERLTNNHARVMAQMPSAADLRAIADRAAIAVEAAEKEMKS